MHTHTLKLVTRPGKRGLGDSPALDWAGGRWAGVPPEATCWILWTCL